MTSYLRGVRPFLVRDAAERALWLTRAGKRLPYHTLLKRLHAHADRLALPVTVTPHTFRRSCTTELIRGGANLWHVKELLGHEHLDTLQHYAKHTHHRRPQENPRQMPPPRTRELKPVLPFLCSRPCP